MERSSVMVELARNTIEGDNDSFLVLLDHLEDGNVGREIDRPYNGFLEVIPEDPLVTREILATSQNKFELFPILFEMADHKIQETHDVYFSVRLDPEDVRWAFQSRSFILNLSKNTYAKMSYESRTMKSFDTSNDLIEFDIAVYDSIYSMYMHDKDQNSIFFRRDDLPLRIERTFMEDQDGNRSFATDPIQFEHLMKARFAASNVEKDMRRILENLERGLDRSLF